MYFIKLLGLNNKIFNINFLEKFHLVSFFTILDNEELCKKDSKEKCYILSSKPKDKYSEYSEHKTWVSKESFLASCTINLSSKYCMLLPYDLLEARRLILSDV